MEKIGNLLKEKRLEAGLTIEEVSSKTRLTIKHIKAIEEGDISYFRDDLSYLRYFLRSYCDALGIDFEEIKGDLQLSIDDYTKTFSMGQVQQHEQIEKNVARHVEKMGKTTKPKKKKHRKPDMSLISLIVIVVVIAAALVFAFVVYIMPNIGKEDDGKTAVSPTPEEKVNTPKPEENNEDDKDDKKDNKNDKEEKPAITIGETDLTHYAVSGLKIGEEVSVEITFQSTAWFELRLDGVVQKEPLSKVYNANEVATFKTTAQAASQITMRFGNMTKHIIKVNGVEVKLNEQLTSNPNPNNIVLDLKGE